MYLPLLFQSPPCALHPDPLFSWQSFLSHLSLLLFFPCLLLLLRPPRYRVKREHKGWSGLVNREIAWGSLFTSSFELPLHLKYAHDKKEVSISIHTVLKMQRLFWFFSIMKTLLDCGLCNYARCTNTLKEKQFQVMYQKFNLTCIY